MAVSEKDIEKLLLPLPTLPYASNSLEPWIDEETMITHLTKHHQPNTMRTNLVLKALQSTKFKGINDVKYLLGKLNEIPTDVRGLLRNQGGGHLNHIDFWNSMTPDTEARKVPENLNVALVKSFGSVESFLKEFLQASLSLFGWFCAMVL